MLRKPDSPEISVAEVDKSIAQVIETYKSAVFAKNVDTLMHIYDQSVRVFDAWGIWSYEGSEAWRVAAEGWLKSLGIERVKVTFEDVKATVNRDGAYVSAIVTYASVSEAGVPIRAMQNRLTWVLKLAGHVLRIVHEHTSAPVGFEDMKAILQRESPK
jgi:ketosteroid isomerase-like protein